MSKETIKCQNNTIKRHVKEQIELLGNEADLNHLDVSEVTNMEVLFVKYEDFNGDVSSWNVSNVINMRSMFDDTQFNGDISSWDVSNVENMGDVFGSAKLYYDPEDSVTYKFNGDLSNWTINNHNLEVIVWHEIFLNGLEADLNHLDVSGVTNMEILFSGSPFNGDISKWDVSNVTDMTSMFQDSKFNGDISQWKISQSQREKIELDIHYSISHYFKESVKEEVERLGNDADLNHIDLTGIDDLGILFYMSEFNGDISKWDVSNVKNMHLMFASSKFNGDISGWDVSNVVNMQGMFSKAAFDQDISNWDVGNVIGRFTTDEYGLMYRECSVSEENKPKFED